MTFVYLTATAVVLLAFAAHELMRKRRIALKPPGPPGYPLIGNLLDVPTQNEWKTYAEWARVYGDIMSMSVFGTTIVVISSYQKSIEILEEKGSIYSDRPPSVMTGELMGFGRNSGFLPYGSKWKAARRWFSREIGSSSRMVDFHGQLESQSREFVKEVARSPGDLNGSIDRYAGAIIFRIAYGYQLSGRDDHFLRITNECMDALSESFYPGRFLCNQFPMLRHIPNWMPGASFKKFAAFWKTQFEEANKLPFDWTKSQMNQSIAEESFVSRAFKAGLQPKDEEEFSYVAGTMSFAGSDTTAVSINMLFLALAQHPSIQARARMEVDNVVGRDRMPEMKDTQDMPYLDALLKETLRFHVPTPVGAAHSTIADDVHDGYFIPKGSLVMPNLRLMCRDPSVYQDPDSFNPDRFLGVSPEPDPRNVVFGFGRRVCSGRLLAETSLRITAAVVLWSLDISAVEVDGKVVMPEYKPTGGFVSHIERVEMKVTPRPDAIIQ